MRHPNDGILRRLIDEPAGVADADRQHIAGCRTCQSALTAIRKDAEVVRSALSPSTAPDVPSPEASPDVPSPEAFPNVDAAWHRLAGAIAVEPPRAASPAAAPRWRLALRSPVIAGIAALALLTGATAAAATNWLPIFRTEQVAPVVVTQADLLQLPDLSAYGPVEFTERANVHQVPDATAAQAATGLAAPKVGALPKGVTGQPVFQVGGRVSATFTFSAAKAAQTAAAAGKPLPPPPPGLDGSQFRLTAGPGLAAVWSGVGGQPNMIVGRVVAPTAYSTGIPFATARDYLLSLPGLPADVAAQLRGFATGTTLPFIVNKEEATTSSVILNGVPATVLVTRDGALAGVVWVDRGMVNAVVGSLSADEVLAVARELRWGQ